MKRHLIVLDGLRGTAAISVVIFHFAQISIGSENPQGLWLRHAYLAVDFFFCLSGYVIGYAYDEQRDRLGVLQFLSARLIRLHPMVVAGALLGLASYMLDPFNSGIAEPLSVELQSPPVWQLIVNLINSVLMLPAWPLPNRFGAYYSLNPPAWSLMWEYVASLAFALLLWRLKRNWLVAIVACGAVSLGASAYNANAIYLGFSWGQATDGLARITFSFGAGLLLFRYGPIIRSRIGVWSLSAIMVLLFIGPSSSKSAGNWIYELGVVVVAFPLIIAIGAAAMASNLTSKICALCGRISYPLYMTHSAFVMIFANYTWTHSTSAALKPWVVALLTLWSIVFSYAVLVVYDEPIRRWLGIRRRIVK